VTAHSVRRLRSAEFGHQPIAIGDALALVDRAEKLLDEAHALAQ
jgi:hypothetical protein